MYAKIFSILQRLLPTGVVLALLCCLAPAHASSFCVSNVAGLKTAFALAQLQQSPFTIQIVQGTYVMDASIDYENLSQPTTIEGGYAANCTSRQVDAANTVINVGFGHGFVLRQLSASTQAQINIDGLTISNMNNPLFIQAGQLGTFSNDEGSVNLSRVRLTHISYNDAQVEPIRMEAFNGSVTMVNVLIDNIATPAVCAVQIFSQGGAFVRINHMTADLVGGNNFCVDDDNDSSAVVTVHNSILWNSGGGQSLFSIGTNSGTPTDFINDVFHGQVVSGNLDIVNQINAAPGWIDAVGGNYRLQTSPLSPSINSGTGVTPGGEPATDIEGHLRPIGSAPDRGAYESAYNNQSILTVTNVLDSGAGSLRQAMLDANSSPTIAKSIQFNIRNGSNLPICPAVIKLSSPLPNVAAPMVINGYTQPLSVSNTDPVAFNANICVLITPTNGGSLSLGFRVPAAAASSVALTLRGLGFGGISQPVSILGGSGHLIAGNQFGGTVNGIALAGAGLSTITIGVNAAGSLIVGGQNSADRNVIGGASFNGVDIQATVASSTDKCEIVNNLIGLAPDGITANASAFGINVSGSGCGIYQNRIAGNTIANVLINGGGNVMQQNQIGITAQNGPLSVSNSAIGVLVNGSNNIIGAGGQGGLITANTIRFMSGGGLVIKGDAAVNNSVNANLVYDNYDLFDVMDIDLISTGGSAGANANDSGDNDTGPNSLQNFPIATKLVYTGPGTGANGLDRPGTLGGVLDSHAGTYRIDAYYSSSANSLIGRAHAEVYLGHANVTVAANGRGAFTLPSITVPSQSGGGVISLTATNATGNTSEIGTAIPIDTIFVDGLE